MLHLTPDIIKRRMGVTERGRKESRYKILKKHIFKSIIVIKTEKKNFKTD